MSDYAIYRLPFQDRCTLMMQTHGEPIEVASLAELNGKDGFVIAPFAPSAECPILLLKPDVVETMQVKPVETVHAPSQSMNNKFNGFLADTVQAPSLQEGREHYKIDFANFHAQLEAGTFSKIVLARRMDVKTDAAIAPEDLFMRACNMYPRMFVALVSTKKSGTWLVATPEALLEGDGNNWRTMALAGTMRNCRDGACTVCEETNKNGESIAETVHAPSLQWSDKNIEEQRFVASYITECLERFTDDFKESKPYTARAGDLVHLRSDFDFILNKADCIGDLINTLHPTPAVCGIPKNETREFILENESAPRKYYSGFMGPLCPHGHTHLYVSLRCMQILGSTYSLYAGGGLLKDSVEQMEWEETQAKMETMVKLMYNA